MIKKIFIILGLTSLLLIPSSSRAAITGEGLTISPPIVELTLNPGEASSQTIKLTNPTAQLVEIYPTVMNFSASGEGGEPAFSPASASESKFALANWISFQQGKIALTPEQVVEFKYQIKAPKDAEPGGHYGVVFFGTEPPTPEKNVSQVSLASMIGSLILVRVPGDINENANLVDFSANKFYLKTPVEFTIRIKNLGNVHFKPQGEIDLKSLFGNKTAQVQVNSEKGNVLPDSTRKFSQNWWPSKWMLGRFTANLTLSYGETNQILSGKLSFWIIPIWFIILVGIIILAIIVLIIWRIRRKKKESRPKADRPWDEKKVILR